MIYTDERLRLICDLSSKDGHALREKALSGDAGDAEALGDWTVYAAYCHLRKDGGFDHERAFNSVKEIFSAIDLKPVIVP